MWAGTGAGLRPPVGGRVPVAAGRRRGEGVLLLLALGALGGAPARRRIGAALLLLGLGALALPVPAPAAGPVRSGRYGELALFVRGDAVSGVLSAARPGDGTEAAPQFSCTVLLRGRLRHGRGAVESWNPFGVPGEASVAGSLAVSADGGVSLLLSDNHEGCAATAGDMTRQPFQATRTLRGDAWIGVAMLGAPRAALRAGPGGAAVGQAASGRVASGGTIPDGMTPGGAAAGEALPSGALPAGGPAPGPAIVRQGEALAVLERRRGWVRVSLLQGSRPATGWLRAAELVPAAGPAAR